MQYAYGPRYPGLEPMPPRYGAGSRISRRSRYLLGLALVSVLAIYTLWQRRDAQQIPLTWGAGGGGSDLSGPAQDDHAVQQSPPALESGSPAVPVPVPVAVQDHAEKHPVVGKITISFGETEQAYLRAIRSHAAHNRDWNYAQFTLRERLLPGLWSKHAYIFSVLAQELSKPEAERLQWVMYVPSSFVLFSSQKHTRKWS